MAILDCVEDREHNSLQNFIAIRLKSSYTKKGNHSQVILPTFLSYIDLMQRFEYKTAAKNRKPESHFSKWESIM